MRAAFRHFEFYLRLLRNAWPRASVPIIAPFRGIRLCGLCIADSFKHGKLTQVAGIHPALRGA